MRSKIGYLALAGLLAVCLVVMPALSMPAGDDAKSARCNTSDMLNCYATARGMPMGAPGMGPMNDHGSEMGHAFMKCEKNDSCMNESHNGTKTIEVRQSGDGFAISGNEYHIVKMNIEGEMNPNPSEIAKLISDNKTLAQIKSDIKAKINDEMAAATYNGSLHLAQGNYNLVNIKLSFSNDNSTTIDADVAGPKLNPKDKPTTAVGHITITASSHENSTIGTGTLTMNSGENSGKYNVLLEMGHGMQRHGGMHEYAFAGNAPMDKHFGMNKAMRMPEDKTGK